MKQVTNKLEFNKGVSRIKELLDVENNALSLIKVNEIFILLIDFVLKKPTKKKLLVLSILKMRIEYIRANKTITKINKLNVK